MDERVPSRLKHLRAFGLILAAVLALVSWRRGHPWLMGAGALCALIALGRPDLLDGLERRWMAAARGVARVNTFIVLTLLYYLVLVPYGLLMRRLFGDPLDRAWEDKPSYWKPKKAAGDPAGYERQF